MALTVRAMKRFFVFDPLDSNSPSSRRREREYLNWLKNTQKRESSSNSSRIVSTTEEQKGSCPYISQKETTTKYKKRLSLGGPPSLVRSSFALSSSSSRSSSVCSLTKFDDLDASGFPEAADDETDDSQTKTLCPSTLHQRRRYSSQSFTSSSSSPTRRCSSISNGTVLNGSSQKNHHHHPCARYHYGVRLLWTSSSYLHMEPKSLIPYRKIGDPIVDTILDLSNKEGSPGARRFDDVVNLARDAHRILRGGGGNNTLSPSRQAMARWYHHHFNNVPSWVNWDQLQRGIDVFVTYSPAIGTALFYRSLVGGFSIPLIVEVLEETGYLFPQMMRDTEGGGIIGGSGDDDDGVGGGDSGREGNGLGKVPERLLDTGGFLSSCFSSRAGADGQGRRSNTNGLSKQIPAESLRPGNVGWTMALRVRVLHAKVRRGILLSSSKRRRSGSGRRSNKWDVDRLGVPINQEDMAATLLGFSVNALAGIEFVSGMEVTVKEQEDYLALWRYVGWLLGVHTHEKGREALDRDRDNDDDNDDDVASEDGKSSATKINTRPLDRDLNSNLRQDWTNHEQFPTPYENNLPPLDPCGGSDWNTDPSYDRSFALLESMLCHLLHPNEKSGLVARHLLRIGRPNNRKRLKLAKMSIEGKSCNEDEHGDTTDIEPFMYRYRSVLCRRWLGQPLSDALGLYKPKPCTWEYLQLALLTYVHLMLLRIYTLLAINVPFIRRRMYRWHMDGMNKFWMVWMVGHSKRMERAATVTTTGDKTRRGNVFEATESMSSSGVENTKEEKESTGKNSTAISKEEKTWQDENCTISEEGKNKQDEDGMLEEFTAPPSFCPFGLVMPPDGGQ